ncbi:MAG: hypothetical protein ABL957_10140 [Parvularculaceae bacterium]
MGKIMAIIGVIAVALVGFYLYKDSQHEDAGAAIEEAADDVADAADEVADDVTEAVDDIADDVEDATDGDPDQSL